MAGKFAAEDRSRPPHRRLDEGVADPLRQRRAAVLADVLGHRPRGPDVVDHGAAGLPPEHLAGNQGGDQVGPDRLAVFVHEGGAVAVAVEADAEVRLLLDDEIAQVAQVLRQQRVRLVVREGAVELEVERQQFDAAGLEQGPVDRTHPVRGVGCQSQLRAVAGLERSIEEGEHVLGVLRFDARRVDPPGRYRRLRLLSQGVLLDDRDAVVSRHRHGAGEAELQAVVLGPVVARRDLDAAGGAEPAGGEVVHRRRGETDVQDIEARRGQSVAERLGQRHAVRTHVAADDDRTGAFRSLIACEVDEVAESHADPARQLLVQLSRIEAADIVGLEDSCHGFVRS